ncbi:3-oxoacyl-ACP synthase III family protein [Marilutibacter alkalisoli]|uniref:Ketoacyl-ACP synthase III n=1 Tax=Marilutibacter alkalisoli TaxID=2591633 RepID=A0A514BRL0_9GAMM|nr:ketoacyl-ACP synthase III [Lysobacter alkalisoli]QDH70011.1 ketoacyl-ACP synthase III [Lysobacter alkalisoli]
MAQIRIEGFHVAGVSTCLPELRIDNLGEADRFGGDEVRKVVSMAGVRYRHVVEPGVTASDLCLHAAERLLSELGWAPESVTGLIFVTQSPDYFLPSTACLLHERLMLPDDCVAFDVGMGCSGYPYGLYIAAAMLKAGGHRRILMLHGETPSRFADPDDHATRLLFGDAGSATALETSDAGEASFCLHTDGGGYEGLIIRGGGFRDRTPHDARHLHLEMDGAAIFNFTIKRVPPLIREALDFAGRQADEIDQYVFHQSNRFIVKHLARKCGLPEERVPMTIEDCANCGGPSVAVTLTRHAPRKAAARTVMLVGYGVGLSWGSAVLTLPADIVLLHGHYPALEAAA